MVSASIEVPTDSDSASIGATVTSALCGHWEHDGPCRWPHNNAIDASTSPAQFRTLLVAETSEAAAVATQVQSALANGEWTLVSTRLRDVAASEAELAAHLLTAPRT